MPQTPHNRKALGKIAAALNRTSPANRVVLERLRDHMAALGRSPKTTAPYVQLLQRLDAFTKGHALLELQPEQVRLFLQEIRSPQPRTNRTYAMAMRASLSHLSDIFRDGPLPQGHPLRRAAVLPKTPKRKAYTAPVLEDDELRRVLAAALDAPVQYRRWFWTERVQALVQVCRYGGFRISEALSLNVGDVGVDAGGAYIRLREEAPLLGEGDHKTGPRRVYVAEGLGSIGAWLSVHPRGSAPGAPLFTSFDDRTGSVRQGYDSCVSVLGRLCRVSGVKSRMPSDFRLHWHLFRHTCATMKVRMFGWGEAELRAYFGWSDESKEPATYVHLRDEDIRARVRRDHGLDEAGLVSRAEVGVRDLDARVAAAVAAALARHGL